jgi:hypothetical protein
LRAYFLTSEASVVAIRGLLLADVLKDLLQFEPDRRYGVTSSPEMLAGKIAFLAAQASYGDRTLPLEGTRSLMPRGVLAELQYTYARGLASNDPR